MNTAEFLKASLATKDIVQSMRGAIKDKLKGVQHLIYDTENKQRKTIVNELHSYGVAQKEQLQEAHKTLDNFTCTLEAETDRLHKAMEEIVESYDGCLVIELMERYVETVKHQTYLNERIESLQEELKEVRLQDPYKEITRLKLQIADLVLKGKV